MTHHTQISIRLHACVHNLPIISRLILQMRFIYRLASSNRNIESEVRKPLQILRAFERLKSEMILEADGVDGNAIGHESLYDVV